MNSFDVIIIGSGLSGLSAAMECLDRKKTVLVLEARDVIGGRTSSWIDDGMKVESGLHRVLGFYRHLPRLLKKSGLKYSDVVTWEDEIEFRVPEGVWAIYGFAPIFRFFQTITSFLGNNHYLDWKDKLGFLRFAICGFIQYWFRLGNMDSITVLEFAKKHKVTENAIHRLLLPLTEGIFFLPHSHYSAHAFFGLFSPAVIRLPSLRAGAFRAGMTDVMMEPIAKRIRERGGVVRVSAKVEKILSQNGSIAGVVIGDEEVHAKNVILATALLHAQRIIRRSFPDDPGFKGILELPTMPSVTIQIELDAPSMEVDHTTFGPGTSLSSFSEQSRTTFKNLPGRLSIILAPAEKFLKMKPEEILPVALEDAKKLNLTVGEVKNYRVTYQEADFYRMSPNMERLKPDQKTHIEGLAIAGDYTRQKFYSTMEGAVYSGKLAVKALFNEKTAVRQG
jgi:15-cis-phytoene desaturase